MPDPSNFRPMPTVTILQRVLPHYRIALFERLYERLSDEGISLRLIYGQALPGTVPQTFALNKPWVIRVNNRYLSLGRTDLVWQPVWRLTTNADLLIVEQANRLIFNYFLQLRRAWSSRPLLAFWGHGRNMQAGEDYTVREFFKRQLLTRVDWWFAYTRMSGDFVVKAGFPADQLTIVQNAIDTSELRRAKDAITESAIRELKANLGLTGAAVGLYCGALHENKRIGFLLDACRSIKKRTAGFHLVIVGDGPERHLVERAAAGNKWIHLIGPKYGAERVPYFMMSDALLMPGLVGLVVVDSLAMSLPLITTDISIHSPEISYLENGVNGLMVEPDVESYATAVVGYLQDAAQQRRLKAGCEVSAGVYTLEAATENFVVGIKECLARSMGRENTANT